MLFKLESKPKHSNCPRCQSTDTFLMGVGKAIKLIFAPIYNDSRYCVNCNKKYDKADTHPLY